jgi:hypothetical protein
VHVQPNEVDSRVEHLDESVALLTSEVAALKLELATLTSALRESQASHYPRRPALPVVPQKLEPPSRPSSTPAAIVVVLATGLLSWQLLVGPRSEGSSQAVQTAPVGATLGLTAVPSPQPTIESAPTEPPVTPLVKPTVYKGTLSVAADAPGAKVFVNRRQVGVAPVRVANLKAGAHLVWIEREGFRRWTRVVTVPAERVTRVAADLEPLEPVVEP